MSIVYAQEQDLSVADYVAVLDSTYMRDHRPLTNTARVERMLAGANMIVTARSESGDILGLGRGISDGEWVVYLADLAVHADHQRKGIGTGILRHMKSLIGPGMGIVLLAYEDAVPYYRKIGLGEGISFFVNREIRT